MRAVLGDRAGVEDLDALDLARPHRAPRCACPWRNRRDSPSPPSPPSARLRQTSADRNSSIAPSQEASNAGTMSDIIRSISTWHSGSPKRTLYSNSFGPCRRQHHAGIEHAAERRAARLHAGNRRQDDLRHDLRRGSPASRTASANRRPCRRCSGPGRGRTRACGPARRRAAIAVSPSHSAKKLISRPARNSSITTSAPAAPNAPSNIMAMAASASRQRHGDHDALAGGEPVGLDHDRRALLRAHRPAHRPALSKRP